MTELVDLPAEDFDALRPQPIPGVEVRHFGNDLVAWAPAGARPELLQGVAAVVFQILDDKATVADLIKDIREVVGIGEEVVRTQLGEVLAHLKRAGLIAGVPGATTSAPKLDYFPAPPNP